MVACLESLYSANVSDIIQQAASLIPELCESNKDGEFLAKITFSYFQHSYTMETTQRDHVFAVMNKVHCSSDSSSAATPQRMNVL